VYVPHPGRPQVDGHAGRLLPRNGHGGGLSLAVLSTLRDVAEAAAILASALLGGLAVFQAGLVAGRPWGRLAWGGQHEVLPARLRIGSAVSIVLYAAIAAVVLTAAVLVRLVPRGFADVAIWLLVGYFALGILLNGISRSRPERVVMTPLVLLLSLCCLVVALQ
jgi:hypothetical protein